MDHATKRIKYGTLPAPNPIHGNSRQNCFTAWIYQEEPKNATARFAGRASKNEQALISY
jgi:hypothetical protein